MGKILLIKNADFSSVALSTVQPQIPETEKFTEWYIIGYDDIDKLNRDLNYSIDNGGWYYDTNILGNKTINTFKFKASKPGTVDICELTNDKQINKITSFYIESADLENECVKYVDDFIINANSYLIIGNQTADGGWYWSDLYDDWSPKFYSAGCYIMDREHKKVNKPLGMWIGYTHY